MKGKALENDGYRPAAAGKGLQEDPWPHLGLGTSGRKVASLFVISD